MKITVISNGMGSQSKLLPILLYEKHPLLKEFWNVDLIINIFADTGDEPNYIYEDLKEYQLYLKEHNYPELIIVRRCDFLWKKKPFPYKKMSDYYRAKKVIPTRKFRHCTAKFKIAVIEKYLKVNKLKGHAIKMLIGFTLDEANRIKDNKNKWITNEFPFIYDLKYIRSDCYNQLELRGLHWHKSGCGFCPYLIFPRFWNYYKDKPKELALIIEMEENAIERRKKAGKKPIYLFNLPLKQLVHNKNMQTDLTDFLIQDEQDKCDSGFCFI